MDFKKYFEELKRRKVFKAAIAYLVVAWVIVEVATAVLPVFDTPPVVLKTLVIVLSLGFLANLVLSWIYEVTPEGLKKTDDLKTEDKVSPIKYRRQNRVLITLLSLAIVLLLYNQFSHFKSDLPQASKTDSLTKLTTASIAVLPFKNWSGDAELEYISDGMADEIATKLERSKNMERVIPFREMLQYKESKIKLRELTDTLQVQFILDGSVQISGGQIRVKVQLLDGNDNRYIWSDEFIGIWDSKDVFAIQAKVTENILERINIKVDQEAESYKDYISTDNMEAYRSYLKGNYQTRSEVGVVKAIANYEKAVELDSSFIEAWYALGRTWMFSGLYWGVNPERVAWNNTKKCWEKVIELAEHHPEAKEIKESVENSLLWNYLFYEWDFNRLERRYVQGFDDPVGLKPVYELYTGRYKESLKTIEEYILRASEQGRINGRMIPLKAGALFFLDQRGEAEKQLAEYDEILWDNPTYLTESAKWYYYLGKYDKSRKALNHLIAAFNDSSPLILFLTAVNSYEDESLDEREEAIKGLKAKYESQKSGSPGWYLALYYAHTGAYESSMEWLQQSFQSREVELVWLRTEPLLAPIRNDARYLKIYSEVGFPVPPLSFPEDTPRIVN